MNRLNVAHRLALVHLALLFTILLTACASAPPHAVIAHVGTDVLEELRLAQTGVISLNISKALPDDTTRTILDRIKVANEAAGKLSEALKAYNAAVSDDALGKVQTALGAFQAVAGTIFNVQIPAPVVAQIEQLSANVNKTILAIQLELAKGHS